MRKMENEKKNRARKIEAFDGAFERNRDEGRAREGGEEVKE